MLALIDRRRPFCGNMAFLGGKMRDFTLLPAFLLFFFETV
jgi:hypothetical protein